MNRVDGNYSLAIMIQFCIFVKSQSEEKKMFCNQSIHDLSPHLFWEYDVNTLNLQKHKDLIIKRVLEFGTDNDWQLLKKIYELEEIKNVAVNARSLDAVAMSFIALITETPIESFRCYKLQQSTPGC